MEVLLDASLLFPFLTDSRCLFGTIQELELPLSHCTYRKTAEKNYWALKPPDGLS